MKRELGFKSILRTLRNDIEQLFHESRRACIQERAQVRLTVVDLGAAPGLYDIDVGISAEPS